MSIAWHDFDWQSFATLGAGGMAAVAAGVIGLRQMRITDRQNEILKRQVILAEIAVRHDLFERRYAVYDAARQYLGFITRHAEAPPNDLKADFLDAMNHSRLLFREEVHDNLREIWARSNDFIVLKAEMDRIYRQSAHYGEGNPEREHDLLTAIHDDLVGLVDLFGDELKLTDDGLER